MAKRILVPLDDNTEHEAIVPLVADVARSTGAAVRLLHVAPQPESIVTDDGHVLAYLDQEAARVQAQWLDILRRLEPLLSGIDIDVEVTFGNPLTEILAEADAFGADLIAVTTSTHKTLKDRMLGSVAADLIKRSRVAVLLLRPTVD